MDIRDHITAIPDYPRPGIIFRDITSLIETAEAFRFAVNSLIDSARPLEIDRIAGIEARGLIFGGAMAYELGLGFLPIRKEGKLPRETIRRAYELEYGSDSLEMHVDAVGVGDRILLVDDLIATGGTAEASIELIRDLGGHVVAASFVIDLPDLGGSRRLEAMGCPVHTLVAYEGE